MEYAGAVAFRSLTGDGREIEPEPPPDCPLGSQDLDALLDQVIEEMRWGTIDHRRLGLPPITPSGSLPKFAVHRHPVTGDWHVPGANRLSTHIVKHEERADMPGEAAVEAVCQRALRELGVRAAPTSARVLGNRQVIVSERTDRLVDRARGKVVPVHQEEWACACGRDPDELVQRAGTNGGWKDLYRFLTQRSASRQVEQEHFWMALAAITLLGHRDMHRRNVAVRYGRAEEPYRAELAPLYDVASMDGQGDDRWRSLGLAIGGEEEIDRIGERAWERIAHECRADPAEVLGLVADTARRLPDAIATAARKARDEDEWREYDKAIGRIEALKSGTAKRARRAQRPTTNLRTRPSEPEWIEKVLRVAEQGTGIELQPDEHDNSLLIQAVQEDGTKSVIGRASSLEAYYRALWRAGAVAAEDVPYLERTLERKRKLELARARTRSRR